MILIFDLDDTLYPEHTYVQSGLTAVAEYLHENYEIDPKSSLAHMQDTLAQDGRGRVFNRLLEVHGISSLRRIRKCISVYRGHEPDIKLYPETNNVLDELSQYPHYLVTDGNKLVQNRKIVALGIECRFRRVYITHRYGVKHAKPSTYCFEKIRSLEHVDWEHIVYIGDNPNKDFVNLNKCGACTVRVNTGMFRNVSAIDGYDAQHTVEYLADLPSLIHRQNNSGEPDMLDCMQEYSIIRKRSAARNLNT